MIVGIICFKWQAKVWCNKHWDIIYSLSPHRIKKRRKCFFTQTLNINQYQRLLNNQVKNIQMWVALFPKCWSYYTRCILKNAGLFKDLISVWTLDWNSISTIRDEMLFWGMKIIVCLRIINLKQIDDHYFLLSCMYRLLSILSVL